MKVASAMLLGLYGLRYVHAATEGCESSKPGRPCYQLQLYHEEEDCQGEKGWHCDAYPDNKCCGTDGKFTFSCGTDAPEATVVGGVYKGDDLTNMCAIELTRGKTCASEENGFVGCYYTFDPKNRMDTQEKLLKNGCGKPNWGWQIIDDKRYSIIYGRPECDTWANMPNGPEKEAFIMRHADKVEDVAKKRA